MDNHKKERLMDEYLKAEQDLQKNLKAPTGFTDSVMSAIYRLDSQRSDTSSAFSPEKLRTAYRRLGFSLVLTAAVIMFSLLMPGAGGFPGITPSGTHPGEESGASAFVNIFSGFDSGVKGFFKSMNDSVIDLKGGSDNEM